jgi:hypothetical protein
MVPRLKDNIKRAGNQNFNVRKSGPENIARLLLEN